MWNVRATVWAGGAVLAALLAFVVPPCAGAKSHGKGTLTATSAAPDARGRATLALKTASKGRFRVAARGLARKASFDLLVGGIKVGSFTTNAAGSGKIKLSTHPKGAETLLGVDPRGKSIVVRDEHGADDLDGDLADDDDSSSGAFVCCRADDDSDHGSDEDSDSDGAECDMETPDECAAEGGTMLFGLDTCIPNPCGDEPPDDEVVCCFPGSVTGALVDGEGEPDCEDTGAQECALTGGVVVEADSCDPNPCAAVPPSDVTACCIPEESEDGDDDHQGDESECEVVTFEQCSALGGTATDATSCDDDPCGDDGSSGDD